MTLSKSNPRAKQRWALLVAVVAGLMIAFAATSLAVHDLGEFELDKNATNDLNVTGVGYLASNITATATSINVCQTGSAPGAGSTILVEAERMTVSANAAGSFGGSCPGTKRTYTVSRGAGGTTASAHSGGAQKIEARVSLLVVAAMTGPDWNQVHAANVADPNTKCESLGLAECTYVHDGIGPTTFTGGSTKDHLPVSGWQHTSGASPDKGEILNAYAAKAIAPDDDQILYFGMDRYAVDGSTDIGFWFFQGEVGLNNDGTFSGNQQVGDILILGTFTQGGAASDIRVFEWVGTGGNESNTLQGPTGAFADCVPGAAGDFGCATVNDTTIEVPWSYTFKGSSTSGWVPAGGFFEGGVNLTEIGLEGCFSSFLAETRSSPEITAILKDFALGSFEACDTELTTTPSNGSGAALADTDDPANGIPDIQIGTGADGIDVTDSAELEITGTDTWSGTLDFYLCGPIATSELCDGTDNVGLLVDSQSVSDADATTTYTSASANLTEVGYYCWRGEFLSDTDGVPDATDASIGECFEVLPVQPTLDTQAWSSGDSTGSAQTDPVPFGDPLFDKASLAGTAHQPGDDGPSTEFPSINAPMDTAANGTITFTLIGPGDCETVATGTGTNPETGVTVAGDGDYFSSGFTPDLPGDYSWQAAYDGDSPNTLSASHNDDCSDTDEDVTVQQLQPTMDTAQSFVPNDLATIEVAAGAGDLDGNVTFYLWVDDDTCGGDDLTTTDASFGPFAVFDEDDGLTDPLTDSVESDNTTAYDVDGTTFHWVVVFESTTTSHLDVTSGCGNEHSSIDIDNGVTQPPATP